MARHTYFPSARDDEKRRKAVAKAKARGEAAVKLFNDGFKLTPETQPEFNRLMKQVDKDLSLTNNPTGYKK